MQQIKNLKNLGKTNTVLCVFAIVISVLVFLKAIFVVDLNYDVGWYHHPFAARIWGIVPKELFESGDKIEYRYLGFPLLAHFFQGMLWKITGRIQSTNLVGYLSLMLYVLFLRSFFKIPWYLSIIALLAIPAVLTHATTSFVDLPGNIGVSIAVMMLYKFFTLSRLPSKAELFVGFLGAAAAVNTKPQLQPLALVVYLAAAYRLVRLYWRYSQPTQHKVWKAAPLATIASILIFATPIKNTVFYGNPVYPIKIEVAGIVLNHQAAPQTYNKGNRSQRWLQSILEINTPKWSADQWNQGNQQYLDRAGGFFGAYVLFNLLLLFICFCEETIYNFKQDKNKVYRSSIALIFVLLLSLFVANFPQSHELRYLMCWMIILVSFNLHLIFSETHSWLLSSFYRRYLSLIYLIFLVIVFTKIANTELANIKQNQQFLNFSDYLSKIYNPAVFENIVPHQTNCIISQYRTVVPIQQVFYYSSYFHPEREEYSLEVAPNINKCNSKIIIEPQP